MSRRGHRGRCYGHSCGHDRGGQGGSGGRRYDNNPYEFYSRYGKFVAEDRVYYVEQYIILSLQQKNNIKEMKNREVWRGFEVTPVGYKLENGLKPVVGQ